MNKSFCEKIIAIYSFIQRLKTTIAPGGGPEAIGFVSIWLTLYQHGYPALSCKKFILGDPISDRNATKRNMLKNPLRLDSVAIKRYIVLYIAPKNDYSPRRGAEGYR